MRPGNWARVIPVAAGTLAGLLLLAGPAAASCVPPPPLEQAIGEAALVFVGTVGSLADEGFRATVQVEEVWKGRDLPPRVEVHGSPGGTGGHAARTSVDRRFIDHTRYLFVLRDDAMPLRDNACSNTSEWQEEFSEHRPADARDPVAEPGEVEAAPTSSAGGVDARLLLGVALGLAALAGAAWWLRRDEAMGRR